jgi:predicted amidohydrolase YtcJ
VTSGVGAAVTSSADTIVVNAAISPAVDAAEPEAVAITDGRILAVGPAADVTPLAGPQTTVIDAGGRRVVPGLIDSHIHLARAGLTWQQNLDWTGVRSLAEGLEMISAAAAMRPAGTWISVVGGWHPGQLADGRGPTPDELSSVAPHHPVYVQLLYESAVLNAAALRAAGFDRPDHDIPNGHIDRDPSGRPTGHVRGLGAFQHCQAAAGRPDLAGQSESTKAFMHRLNELGVTSVVDPGGMGMTPEAYRPLYDLWRRREMTVRVGLYVMPSPPGDELDQVRDYVRFMHPGFGDDWLTVVGLGEILVFGCSDLEGVSEFTVTPSARRQLRDILVLAAQHRWPVHCHAVLDSTISAVLDAMEDAAAEVPGAGARLSLAHADPISEANLERVAALGAGIAVQNRLIFRAADSAALWGDDVARRSPPLRRILELGIPLGAGTDATVVTPYNPWRSLWWLVTGRTLDGGPARDQKHCLTREEAMDAYTTGSAWFSYAEHSRGRIAPGMLADLAVLSADYYTVAEDEIPEITSVLTMVGGNVVHRTSDVP